MSKSDVVEELEKIISKYKGYNDPKYVMAVVEAIKTLAALEGWNRNKPENHSGEGGTW